MYGAQARCFTGGPPLFQGARVKCKKSTHFVPSNFKYSLHTYKVSINPFSFRCQQSIMLSIITVKRPASAPGIKNEHGKVRAWPGWLPFLFWNLLASYCPLTLKAASESSLTLQGHYQLKTWGLRADVFALCDNFSDDKLRWMTVIQGLPCSGGWQDPLWQVLDTENKMSSNLVNYRSIPELPLFLLANATTNWFYLVAMPSTNQRQVHTTWESSP